jgi:hypothetical protein
MAMFLQMIERECENAVSSVGGTMQGSESDCNREHPAPKEISVDYPPRVVQQIHIAILSQVKH